MWVRRILLFILVLLAYCGLPGCAILKADAYGWSEQPNRDSLPAIFRVVSLSEVQSRCPKYPNSTGCAVSDYDHGLCYIYVTSDAQEWTLAHEMLHCAGFDHGRNSNAKKRT